MITMYEAEKRNKGLITRSALGKQTKESPIPLYFHKLKDNSYMINDDSIHWKNYIELKQLKKGVTGEDPRFLKLIKAVKESIDEWIAELPGEKPEDTEALFELITEKFEA